MLVLAKCKESSKGVMGNSHSVSLSCHKLLTSMGGVRSIFFWGLYHKKPNVSYLSSFWVNLLCSCSKSKRTRLDSKAKRCLCVGYDTHRIEWRCMDLKMREVFGFWRCGVWRSFIIPNGCKFKKRRRFDLLSFSADEASNENRINVNPKEN